MARPYKTRSGRIIHRKSSGRFRQSTLADIGLTENTKGYYVCNDCGYGQCEKWLPILEPTECYRCDSKNIEPKKIFLSEKALKLKEEIDKHTKGFIDPAWFRSEYPELKRKYDIEYNKCVEESFNCD